MVCCVYCLRLFKQVSRASIGACLYSEVYSVAQVEWLSLAKPLLKCLQIGTNEPSDSIATGFQVEGLEDELKSED